MWSPPAAQARAKTLAEESTPLPCGPPIIQERSFTNLVGGLMRSHHLDTDSRALSWGFPFPFGGKIRPDKRPTSVILSLQIWTTVRPYTRDVGAPYQTFLPDSEARESCRAILGRELGRRANLRRATAWQGQLVHETLHELEAVSEGHLAHAGNLGNRLLRPALTARQGRKVDRRGGSPRGAQGHRVIDLLEFFENLVGLRLHGVAQPETGTETADIVHRPGGRDAERQRPKARAVRFADRLLADAGHLLQFVQRPWDSVDSTRSVHGGGDDGFDGTTSDESPLEGLLANEPRLVLDGSRKAHERSDTVEGSDRLRQTAFSGTRVARMALELPHPVELLPLPQRNRVPSGILIRKRDDRRESRRARNVAPRRPGPSQAVVLLNRIGGPLRPLVNRTLADDETAGIADKLAARVVAHEVLAATFRTDTVLFHDRVRRR